MSTIWDSRLLIRLQLEGGMELNRQFLTTPTNRSHLAWQLLLYDSIVIPTKDFGVIAILAEWCGLGGLRYLLWSGAVQFAWLRSHVAYGGNGLGLTRCYVERPANGWENWYQQARWGELESAVEAQIDNMFPTLSKLSKSELIDDVVKVSYEPKGYDYKEETLRDFSTIAELNHALYLLESVPASEQIAFNSLANLGNVVRMPSAAPVTDGVDLVVRVAEINSEITMAAEKEFHLNLPGGTSQLLQHKVRRSIEAEKLAENFMTILSIDGIPDVRPAIECGEISLFDLLTIRSTRKAERFRGWLSGVEVDDPVELRQLYSDAIGKRRSRSLPVTSMRFGVTALASSVDWGLGLAAAAVDSFFVSKWIDGYSPSYSWTN